MEWIRMEDQLPDLYMFCLVCEYRHEEPCPYSLGRFNGKKWELLCEDDCDKCYAGCYSDLFWDINSNKITHWMTLPKLPNAPKIELLI